MTFNAWLKGQRKRDDPIGDLSRDVIADMGWPRRTQKLQVLQEYMKRKMASQEALLALEDAWKEYKAQEKVTV